MRHSRSDAFRRAIEPEGQAPSRQAARWMELASDPNNPNAIAHRAAVLRRAWRDPIDDRARFLEDRCRNRKVLDVGCVAHDLDRTAKENWLHARIASVAADCFGVDVLSPQIAELNRRGYRIADHDLSLGLGPLAAEAPYEVIVAGELIEHVTDLAMLFRTAAAALSERGELIITTPNPYAPERVRSGQLGIIWENVDHIVYAFPSGIAELAERHGLRLAEAMTTFTPSVSRSVRSRVRDLSRAARGSHFRSVGIASLGPTRERRVRYGRISRLWHGLWWPQRRFTGESFVYVIRRGSHDEH